MKEKVILIGGGLAGLMATIKLAEAGYPVDLFSIVPVKRSHSACAQGGMNASVNTKGEGDSPQIHFEETIHGGDYLANQAMVLGMCQKAPGYIDMLDRMGFLLVLPLLRFYERCVYFFITDIGAIFFMFGHGCF